MALCIDCFSPFEPEETRVGKISTTVRCPVCRTRRAKYARKVTSGAIKPSPHKRCPVCHKPVAECLGNCMTEGEAAVDHVLMLAQPEKWAEAHRTRR